MDSTLNAATDPLSPAPRYLLHPMRTQSQPPSPAHDGARQHVAQYGRQLDVTLATDMTQRGCRLQLRPEGTTPDKPRQTTAPGGMQWYPPDILNSEVGLLTHRVQ